MEKLYSIHNEEFGGPPELIVSAPGLVNILGGHTDYNEGYVLQTAISQSVKIAVSRREDNALRFYAADLNERKRTTTPNLKYKREDRWANYLKGVCAAFMKFGFPLKGLNISLSSEIPAGIGLSSSSAIAVAATEAIRKLFRYEISDAQFIQIANSVENEFIDLSQQLTGPLGCFLSKKNTAMFLDLRTLDIEYLPIKFDDYSFIITDSNLPVISAKEETKNRKQKCRECVGFLNQKKNGSALRDYSENDLKQGMGLVPEPVRRLCLHVVAENEKVLEGKDALLRKDIQALGKLMSRSHESLRDNYEVSCPELDWLIKRAWETEGVLGSRMNGPGFCGCTVSLIRNDCIENYRSQIKDYDHIFGFAAGLFPLEPSDGVCVLYPGKS